ncbi:MAG TPA: hypothetical protein VM077_06115 [Candidatus Limnocylindrales bacterium]|nr:hypothetical protein [Candidatus Limnocylindrales bacterium]
MREALRKISNKDRGPLQAPEMHGRKSRSTDAVHGAPEAHTPSLFHRLGGTHRRELFVTPVTEASPARRFQLLRKEKPTQTPEQLKAQKRSENGKIGAMVRNRVLRPEHVGENGQIDSSKLTGKYFDAHPEAKKLLEGKVLSEKSKLRKRAEKLNAQNEADQADEVAKRRNFKTVVKVSEGGALLFVGLVAGATSAAAAEAPATSASSAIDAALAQATAVSGKDISSSRGSAATPEPVIAQQPAVSSDGGRAAQTVAVLHPEARQLAPVAKATPEVAVSPAVVPSTSPNAQIIDNALDSVRPAAIKVVTDAGQIAYDNTPESLKPVVGPILHDKVYVPIDKALGGDGDETTVEDANGKVIEKGDKGKDKKDDKKDEEKMATTTTTCPPDDEKPTTTTTPTTKPPVTTVPTTTPDTTIPPVTVPPVTVPEVVTPPPAPEIIVTPTTAPAVVVVYQAPVVATVGVPDMYLARTGAGDYLLPLAGAGGGVVAVGAALVAVGASRTFSKEARQARKDARIIDEARQDMETERRAKAKVERKTNDKFDKKIAKAMAEDQKWFENEQRKFNKAQKLLVRS